MVNYPLYHIIVMLTLAWIDGYIVSRVVSDYQRRKTMKPTQQLSCTHSYGHSHVIGGIRYYCHKCGHTYFVEYLYAH